MRTKLTAVCFVFSALAFAAEPAWELAPADAKILVGVDIRGLRNSSLSDSMTPEMNAQMKAPMAMFHVPGIELLDDIDSVFLASTADMTAAAKPTATAAAAPASSTAKPGTPRPSTPFVLVFTGTFPDEHLRPLLKGLHPSYKGINVYRGTGNDPTSIAVLDEHTVLMGDDKSIFRAIDRRLAKTPVQSPLLARARELAAANEIWIVARDTSGNLKNATGPAAIFASEIQGLDLGLAVHDGFNMDIGLDTKTEGGAQMLSGLVSTQMKSAVSTKMDEQKAAEFWRKVKVGADGNRMRLQVALTKEELQENIRTMQQQRGSLASSKPVVVPGAVPAGVTITTSTTQRSVQSQSAQPPKSRTVKIYGLEDGVREIKLDQ